VAVNLVVNGVSYSFPNTGEELWGDNVTNWATAVTSGMLQKAGGAFTLTADVDFGASWGLKSAYYKSRAAAPATTGVVRLGSTEVIAWRNAANSANLPLTTDASDFLTYNGDRVLTGSGGVLPPTQGGTGQSTYAKGDTLYASAVNTLSKRTIGADQSLFYVATDVPNWLAKGANGTILTIAAGNLTYATLVDANVSATADITLSKVNGGTANRIIASSGTSNRLAVLAAISAAHVLYADANGLPIGEATLAVTRGGLNLSSVAIGEMLYGSGANTYGKLAAGTSGQFFQSGGAGAPNWRTGYILGSFQTFATPGANTWTRPSGCRAVLVEVVGGGGGSGGIAVSGVGAFGESGGGGGGGYSRRWITNPGATETATVGSAGTAGTAASGGTAGGTGGTSSFGSFLSATGGTGGSPSTPSSGTVRAAPGVGGVGSTGDVNIAGGDGGQGTVAAGTRISTGYGGSSYLAGQRRQTFVSGGQNAGSAGYAYGGGASGGSQDASQAAIAGSAGGAGVVIVWEFY
jgi:hypothetical protein